MNKLSMHENNDKMELLIELVIEQLETTTAQQPTPANLIMQTAMQNEYALYLDRKRRLTNEKASKYKDAQQEQETLDAAILLNHSLGQLSRLYSKYITPGAYMNHTTHTAPIGMTQ